MQGEAGESEAGQGRHKDLAFNSFGQGGTINPLEPWEIERERKAMLVFYL